MPSDPDPNSCPDCGGRLTLGQAVEMPLFDGAYGAARVTRWRVCKSCSYDETIEVKP